MKKKTVVLAKLLSSISTLADLSDHMSSSQVSEVISSLARLDEVKPTLRPELRNIINLGCHWCVQYLKREGLIECNTLEARWRAFTLFSQIIY